MAVSDDPETQFLIHFMGGWYEGQMDPRSGLPHGNGKLKMDGHRYDGQWVQGEAHGYGTEKVSNGNLYQGEWQKGKKSGKGLEIPKYGAS